MQNKLFKLLLRKHRMTPTDEIHKNMNLLKVSDIYECNVLTFVNDIMMKRCPNWMQLYSKKDAMYMMCELKTNWLFLE